MSYSSISIAAPSKAEEGSLVPMSTEVTNISAYDLLFRVKLYAVRDIYAVPTPEETIGSLEVVIGSGQSQVISGTFTMPAWDAIVLVMVYRFIDYWDFDVYATEVVSLDVLTGIITKTEIEVNSIQMSPPVPGVEVGEDFRLHVWGKNTSSESIKMGLRYVITKPTGIVIERTVFELWPHPGPGDTHHFDEGPAGLATRFDVDEPGTWLLQVYLYGNGVLLDMEDMVMFIAVGAPPDDPTLMLGEIVSVEMKVKAGLLDWDILQLPAKVQVGTNFWIRVVALNKTSGSLQLGIRHTITRPDGSTIDGLYMEKWPYTGGDKLHEFSEPEDALTVDQSGEWKLKVELLGGSTSQVLDTWEGVMVQATVEPPEPGELVLIQDYTYPDAPNYVGQSVEECTFKFSLGPEQIPGTDWFRDQAIQAFTDKVEEEGGHMLKLRVWEDTTPILTTDYRVEATSTASPLPWAAIIIGVLAILFIIAITFAIIQVRTFLWGEEGAPPTGFGDMIYLLVMIMIMQMMMGIMDEVTREGFMPTAVKYVEKGKEIVTPVVKAVRRLKE